MRERLQKILAHAGLGSRRGCEELISNGRVEVNGKMVLTLGTKADADTDEIRVDGERIKLRRPVYLALHKPRGVLTTSEQRRGTRRAIDFAPEWAGTVHPIGRLDKDSEGLLLLTNDGALTERLTHPRHGVPKVYHVAVSGTVEPKHLAELRSGVWLAEGKVKARNAHVISAPRRGKKGGSDLEIVLVEGKNRQIRRMLAKLGLPVKRLIRVAIGPVTLDRLKPGTCRKLEPGEVEALRRDSGLLGGKPARRKKEKAPKPQGKRRGKAPARGEAAGDGGPDAGAWVEAKEPVEAPPAPKSNRTAPQDATDALQALAPAATAYEGPAPVDLPKESVPATEQPVEIDPQLHVIRRPRIRFDPHEDEADGR